MGKISLYIADKKVDLDNNTILLFNYTMEDLSNPTIVKNSFSKQITLKGTTTNNEIFGHLYRLDRKTIFDESYTGVNFDALRRTPFTLYNELGEIIEEGYVKLDKVARTSEGVEYSITLYGGLGSFFYSMMYDNEGRKKSLRDIRYVDLRGEYITNPGDLRERSGWEMVHQAWKYMENPEEYDVNNYDNYWCNIVNFAPCYNGLPENFSADKAVINKLFDNVPNYLYMDVDDSNQKVVFSFKQGAGSNLMKMENKHTEWEMTDLRWYLQRPVVRIKAIFDAMCDPDNNGGYSVTLMGKFFTKGNPLYYYGWVTLPMIVADDRKNGMAILNLLSDSLSPAEYIISFAKIFGLVFRYDSRKKAVSIMTRAEFYSEGSVIDLTGRVDVNSITISPTIAQSRFYQYGSDVIGEWAANYKSDYRRDYGIHKVNTGNEFNADVTVVTQGLSFKDAVEVQERSLLYYSNDLARDEGGGIVENFALPKYESVKLQLWRTKSNGEEEMREYDVQSQYNWKRFPFNEQYPLSDFLPKVQLHGANNKVEDGANVLLVSDGVVDTPIWNVYGARTQLSYRLTDDTPDMALLNEGVPCWNLTSINTVELYKLPSFRRCITEESGIIVASLEWGESVARGTHGTEYDDSPKTIYNQWWKKYQSDRYDVDTCKMTCKVNLVGMQVGRDLMRNFFYIENSMWVLNKISNYSITTDDLTECEFIKVKDIQNYVEE